MLIHKYFTKKNIHISDLFIIHAKHIEMKQIIHRAKYLPERNRVCAFFPCLLFLFWTIHGDS